MNIDLAVARLRRALKSSGAAGLLGWVYRSVLPEPMRAQIQTRDFQHRYGNRTSYTVTLEEEDIVFSTRDQYSKEWFFPRYDGQIHEPGLTHLFGRLARSANGIMDVGANLGWFTCIGAVLSEGMVYSFEMDENNVERLRVNVRLNNLEDSVCVEQVAVATEKGEVNYSKSSGSASPVYSLASRKKEETEISVPSISIDAYCKKHVDTLDLVKIDVEGAELKVLRGATESLHHFHPALLVEVHPMRLRNVGSSPREVSEILLENGYTIWQLENFRKEKEEGLEPVSSSKEFAPTENCMLYATHG